MCVCKGWRSRWWSAIFGNYQSIWIKPDGLQNSGGMNVSWKSVSIFFFFCFRRQNSPLFLSPSGSPGHTPPSWIHWSSCSHSLTWRQTGGTEQWSNKREKKGQMEGWSERQEPDWDMRGHRFSFWENSKRGETKEVEWWMPWQEQCHLSNSPITHSLEQTHTCKQTHTHAQADPICFPAH